ncbi:AAA family ATPase [Peptoniphilus timonensis]|uniref:AAA family ATPase n=1 Tax=Peptoniphilus timonensis TaxID=1268254 RepID=UPI0002E0E73F|nr:AAA family ATPase [Peptoniphilus timonensis]
MIYIKNVELHNFQSHNYTEIEFDRGLNVILGNSDAGKTAILRAIKWALYNEPKGDYFIRQGEKEVSVKVTFSNGVVVERSRTPSKNSYYLMTAEGEEMRFEGFGLDVPKEIRNATNMYKVSLDNSNNKSILNIAEQLDGPFLLNEQASLRASAIGRLIGVNYVDDALRNVVRDNKRLSQEIDTLKKSREDYKNQLKEFEYIDDYKNRFEKISAIRNKIENLQHKLDLASKLKDDYEKNENAILETNNLVLKFKDLDKIENILPKLENYLIKKNSFENYQNRLLKTAKEIDLMNLNLDKLKNINNLSEKTKVIEAKEAKLQNYLRIEEKYKINFSQINELLLNLDKFRNNDQIESIIKNLEKNINFYNKLSSSYIALNKILSNLKIGEDYIKKFDNNKNISDIFKSLQSKLIQLNKLKELNIKYCDLKNNIKYEENEIEKIIQDIKNYTDSYEKTILELGVCPFCYSEINSQSIDHIKYHLRND